MSSRHYAALSAAVVAGVALLWLVNGTDTNPPLDIPADPGTTWPAPDNPESRAIENLIAMYRLEGHVDPRGAAFRHRTKPLLTFSTLEPPPMNPTVTLEIPDSTHDTANP